MFTYPGGFDPSAYPEPFASRYRTHLQHLKLKGLQPKTIDAYARGIRRQLDLPALLVNGSNGQRRQVQPIVQEHQIELLIGR